MSLTRRQWEVLRLRALGYSYEETGAIMGITHKTVRNHIQGAYLRLDVNNLVDAIRHPAVGWLVVPGQELP